MLSVADFTDEELDGEVRHRQNRKRITVEDQRRGQHGRCGGLLPTSIRNCGTCKSVSSMGITGQFAAFALALPVAFPECMYLPERVLDV